MLVVGGQGDRETNRFLARLGLTSLALLRTAPVAVLRTRRPVDSAGVAGVVRVPRRNRHVGQVVAARRTQRRMKGHHPAY